MFTKAFWVDTLERVIRTFAQALIANGLFDTASADLETTVATKVTLAAGTAGLALLMAVAGQGLGNRESASFLPPADGQ
jgi:hypothetical protein